MWLTWGLTEKPLTMALGLVSSVCTGFLGSWSVWMLTFLDLEGGGEELGLPTGQETLTALGTGEGGGEGVRGAGGYCEE